MTNQHIGQLLFIGIKGLEIDTETNNLLSAVQPGGIVLFKRNIQSAPQLQSLVKHINSLCAIPPFIAIDQEGGRVQRLQEILPSLPAPLTLVNNYPLPMLKKITRIHAQLLIHLGINLNLYPVLDLLYENKNNNIGDRCLSSDPRIICTIARKLLKEYQKTGLLCCGKHFPGLGCTDRDSHEQLPTCPLSAAAHWTADLLPYRMLIDHLPCIMVGHCYYPNLTKDHLSSLSPAIITTLLVKTLGYEGIIITDDLEMLAVARQILPQQAAVRALLAGCHLAMLCHSYDRIHDAFLLLNRQFDRPGIGAKLRQKTQKIIAYKQQHLPTPLPATPFKTLIRDLKVILS
jgi:beta-N-acetylhexosaminidase